MDMDNTTVDPMDQIIEVKEERVVDSFTLNDLNNQLELIEAQIKAEKDALDVKLAGLYEEKQKYIDKIAQFSA